MDENKLGIIYTASSYLLWGLLPLYWKLMNEISAWEILAHRIIWSLGFVIILIFSIQRWDAFKKECRAIIKNKKKAIGITLASLFITMNWFTYIWAVNSNHVVEVSLGYYINPLVSIILGMIVLKEKLSPFQFISFFLAAIGVGYMTLHFGSFPWIALMLAFSFGMYGLLKKLVPLESLFGLAIETMIVTPIALIYLTTIGGGVFGGNASATLLLLGGGIATAIPLLLFASGAKRIPLSMVGFLQYIAPTLMLIFGVFLYGEPFTNVHIVSFTFIWVALIIYSVSRTRLFLRIEKGWQRKGRSLGA